MQPRGAAGGGSDCLTGTEWPADCVWSVSICRCLATASLSRRIQIVQQAAGHITTVDARQCQAVIGLSIHSST